MFDFIQLISDYYYYDVIFRAITGILIFIFFIYSFYLIILFSENKLKLKHGVIFIIGIIVGVYIIITEDNIIQKKLAKLYHKKYTRDECLYLLNTMYNDEELIKLFKIKCYEKINNSRLNEYF